MDSTAAILLDVELHDPDQEDELLAWWRDLVALARERFRAGGAELYVLGRGRYVAEIQFQVPGIWRILVADHRYRDPPHADVTVRKARRWSERDLTTSSLIHMLHSEDVILVDVRQPDAYEAGHIAGAVRWDKEVPVEKLVGTDKERTIVAYCSSYG